MKKKEKTQFKRGELKLYIYYNEKHYKNTTPIIKVNKHINEIAYTILCAFKQEFL